MKTAEQIEAELEELIQSHYYSESYTLEYAVKTYRDELEPSDQSCFEQVILKRLTLDPSVVNIAMCARLDLLTVAPAMIALLDRETECSCRSLTIMNVLGRLNQPGVYEALERFMDSSQAHEALVHLARLDFHRARPHVMRAMFGPNYQAGVLHILFDRKKEVGLDRFIADLMVWRGPDPAEFRRRVDLVFQAKKKEHNPFQPREVALVLEALT